MKQILAHEPDGWFVKKINKPTRAQNFKGEVIEFSHFYRVYDAHDNPIKYCKFQQIERFSKTMGIPFESLTIID